MVAPGSPPKKSPKKGKGGAGGAKPPCPYKLECKWLDVKAYCGDEAKLEVTVTPTPKDGPVRVQILHPSSKKKKVVATITGQMKNGKMQAIWIAKSQTKNWRKDKISFKATASSVGVSGKSSNQFEFKDRPTTAWTLLNIAHASGNGFADAHEKHDARLETNRVHYNLKLRTYGRPFGAKRKSSAKKLIQRVWNRGFARKKFHRTKCKRGRRCNCRYDCCKVSFRLDVSFVAAGEHVAVDIRSRSGSGMNGNGGYWESPVITSFKYTYPHEIGHVLGQADEYPAGATDPTGVQPPNGKNLMSCDNSTLLNRHYRWVLKYLNNNAGGDTYETISP